MLTAKLNWRRRISISLWCRLRRWFLLFALICVVSANGVCSARRNRDIIILNGLSPGLLMLYWQRKHSVLQAEEKGLGICYLGTTTYNPQMIIEALELPEVVFPITTVTVGWPAEVPAQVDRLPLEAVVHEEIYHDYTSEDIDRLYAYKESLPENIRFIIENNKETLAQVFTDVRYTKKDSEAMSENLWKVMKEQGF